MSNGKVFGSVEFAPCGGKALVYGVVLVFKIGFVVAERLDGELLFLFFLLLFLGLVAELIGDIVNGQLLVGQRYVDLFKLNVVKVDTGDMPNALIVKLLLTQALLIAVCAKLPALKGGMLAALDADKLLLGLGLMLCAAPANVA